MKYFHDGVILLVEDNIYDVKLTLKALKKHNIDKNIVVVHDGEEALNYIFFRGKYASREARNIIRFILLDLKLPKIDGIEVLKILKNDERSRSIPVIMLTSSKEEIDIKKSYSYGVNSYVVKPLEFDHFIKVISGLGLYWLNINELPQLN